jgi:hypothetical protein
MNAFLIDVFLFCTILILFGCGNEEKKLQSAESYYSKGDYKEANQVCQSIIKSNPKPEILARAKTLLIESTGGIAYNEIIKQLMQDKKTAFYKLNDLKINYHNTVFGPKFDSIYQITKTFLLKNDLEFSLQALKDSIKISMVGKYLINIDKIGKTAVDKLDKTINLAVDGTCEYEQNISDIMWESDKSMSDPYFRENSTTNKTGTWNISIKNTKVDSLFISWQKIKETQESDNGKTEAHFNGSDINDFSETWQNDKIPNDNGVWKDESNDNEKYDIQKFNKEFIKEGTKGNDIQSTTKEDDQKNLAKKIKNIVLGTWLDIGNNSIHHVTVTFHRDLSFVSLISIHMNGWTKSKSTGTYNIKGKIIIPKYSSCIVDGKNALTSDFEGAFFALGEINGNWRLVSFGSNDDPTKIDSAEIANNESYYVKNSN